MWRVKSCYTDRRVFWGSNQPDRRNWQTDKNRQVWGQRKKGKQTQVGLLSLLDLEGGKQQQLLLWQKRWKRKMVKDRWTGSAGCRDQQHPAPEEGPYDWGKEE